MLTELKKNNTELKENNTELKENNTEYLSVNPDISNKLLMLYCVSGDFEKKYNINKQVKQPIIVNLNKKSLIPKISDFFVIAGFLVSKINFELLKKEYFILEFKNSISTQIHKIPFSFLIEFDKITEINDKYYIKFNTTYFYNYYIPLITVPNISQKLLKNDVSCEISNNVNVEIIFECLTCNLNCHIKFAYITTHLVRQIHSIKLNYNSSCYENNECDLLNFCDGFMINLPKNMIESFDFKFYLKNEDNNKTYHDILNYNSDLINIYGEELSPTMTYFAFGYKFDTYLKTNKPLDTGFNFTKTDGTTLKIYVKNKINDEITVYFPYYEEFTYYNEILEPINPPINKSWFNIFSR
jgi:hypothetical protein